MKINSNIRKTLSMLAGPARLCIGSLDDARRFKKYSYYFQRNNKTKDNLRGEMTFYYHAIEKGLCHDKIRLGFGKRKIQYIFLLLDRWINEGNELSDSRFLSSIGVLKRYIQVHKENGYNVDLIESQLNEIEEHITNKRLIAGEKNLTRDEILANTNSEFTEFSYSRHSVRNFGSSKIKRETLEKAITVANKYPSVCNRQSVRTYTVSNKNLIDHVLEIQGGIHGMAKNVSYLIAITSDIQYFGRFNERNQSFVDGGIYLMNLLYGMTYYGIASCTLNADLNLKKMKKVKSIISIPDSENIIAFVICGSYPEKFKVPVSHRDTESITNHFVY